MEWKQKICKNYSEGPVKRVSYEVQLRNLLKRQAGLIMSLLK